MKDSSYCMSVVSSLALSLVIGWTSLAEAQATDGSMLLHVSTDNPRYFVKADGEIVYLAGAYWGHELTDYAFGAGLSVYSTVEKGLVDRGMNLLRLWTTETTGAGGSQHLSASMPWQRSGICCAADGGNKWDLDAFSLGNQERSDVNAPAYFERMRARILALRAKNIYVQVMLFHSFGWEKNLRIPNNDSWSWHPFAAGNNVNGVDADHNADGQGREMGERDNAVYERELAYVRQVLDTVRDLDNVLIEICNECYDGANENGWQNDLIEYVHQYEILQQSLRHPVVMTSLQNFNNAPLALSAAEAVEYGGPGEETNPVKNDGVKINLSDWDHINPCVEVPSPSWPWRAFTRGHNLVFLYCKGADDPSENEELVIARMAQTRTYAAKLNLKTAIPNDRSSDCSTEYCLIGPTEALGYLPTGGTITLTVFAAGTWTIEWFDPATGQMLPAASITVDRAGQYVTFVAPYRGESVLFARQTGGRGMNQ